MGRLHLVPVLVPAAVALTAGVADAQRIAAFDSVTTMITEMQPPTALLPAPASAITTYPAVPALPPAFPTTPLPGDSTFDESIGVHWYTDGLMFAAMPLPGWTPGGPVPPGPIPISGAAFMAIGGTITGIALDAAAGIMYVCGLSGIVVGVTPVAGMPIVIPAFPVPTAFAPVIGLEFDGATGSLWAIDATATAHNFLPGGVSLGPAVTTVHVLPDVPNDLAIDKIGSFNAAGLRPLYITGGGVVVDMTDPAAPMFAVGFDAAGIAFVNHPAEEPPLPGCEGCPMAYAGPTAFTTSAATTGNGVFTIGAGGLPAGAFVVFAFDTVAAPFPFPLVNGPAACPLGLMPSPTLLLAIGGPAGPAGDVLLPLSLTGVSVGLSVHNQNFTFCAAQPTGLAFSRFQSITVGGL
jgi:hypothetical protein